MKQEVRPGRREVVEVLRVDQAKGYVDLSKKRIEPGQPLSVEFVEDCVNCTQLLHISWLTHYLHILQNVQESELRTNVCTVLRRWRTQF